MKILESYKKIAKSMLTEHAWDRKFGEPLPTLEDVMKEAEVDDEKMIKYKDKDGETKQMKAGSAKTMDKDHPAKQAWDKLADKGGEEEPKGKGLEPDDFERDFDPEKPEDEPSDMDTERPDDDIDDIGKPPQPDEFDGDMEKYLDALNQHMKDDRGNLDLTRQIDDLKKRVQEAELELSLVKAVGMNSPEMRAAKARIEELERDREILKEDIDRLSEDKYNLELLLRK